MDSDHNPHQAGAEVPRQDYAGLGGSTVPSPESPLPTEDIEHQKLTDALREANKGLQETIRLTHELATGETEYIKTAREQIDHILKLLTGTDPSLQHTATGQDIDRVAGSIERTQNLAEGRAESRSDNFTRLGQAVSQQVAEEVADSSGQHSLTDLAHQLGTAFDKVENKIREDSTGSREERTIISRGLEHARIIATSDLSMMQHRAESKSIGDKPDLLAQQMAGKLVQIIAAIDKLHDDLQGEDHKILSIGDNLVRTIGSKRQDTVSILTNIQRAA